MAQGTTTALLRLFSPASVDHFYTTSVTERDNAVAKSGYVDEGVACYVFPAAGTGTTPLLRVYSPVSGDHFYTTSVAERDTAVAKLGYVDEGVACHVFTAAGTGTTPLLRVFNQVSGDHFYTTSVAERDNAVDMFGYVSESVACHVYLTPTPAAATTPATTTTQATPTTKKEEIEVEGEIIEVLPNDMYRAQIDEEHVAVVVPPRLTTNYPHILVGDKVRIVLSPWDLSRGRIIDTRPHP